jgi:predicted nucleotidyltransferase component of viral defense system
MIKPGEIQNKAREVGVRDQQIEKDYVLSWILQGISQHDVLSKAIIFKGYRFSEDLDFTLLDDTISNEQVFEWFSEAFEYIEEEANIPLEIIDNNEHEDGGINFYISYIGPLGGQGNNKKVKIDIARSEKLTFEPVMVDVIISYTDQEAHQLLCYPLEEVLVEKLRSVMQRMQPRDFYDVWYLLEIHGMDAEFYIHEFREKCESKKVTAADFHTKLKQRLPQYKGRWQKSMADQIHDLPDFEKVEREVMRHLKKFVV